MVSVEGYTVDLTAIDPVLPTERVDAILAFQGATAYFDTTLSSAGSLDGTYPGYCVDLDHFIYSGYHYNMALHNSYSSDAELLSALIDHPEALPQVNYILNQDYSSLGVTGRDLQAAVWIFVDDKLLINGDGGITWNQEVVDAIVADADANGVGYQPPADGKVAVLLHPNALNGLDQQVTIISAPVKKFPESLTPQLGGTESAWAEGFDFPGKNWAMYVEVVLD